MRQRTINWSGAMRDMRRYRSPEQMLIREMLDALKEAVVQIDYLQEKFAKTGTGEAALTRLHAVIRKAEARNV